MLETLKRYAWLVVLSLWVVSCTTVVVDNSETDLYRISFGNPHTESRAVVEGVNLPAATSFVVWGGYGNDIQSVDATNLFDAVLVSEDNGIWNYEGGFRYWVPGYTYNFYAVYPNSVVSSCTPDGTISVTGFDCSQTGTEALDLMTAQNTGITYSGGDVPPAPVDLKFSHELAKVKFTVQNSGAATNVNFTKFKINGVPYIGKLEKTTTPNENRVWSELANTKSDDGKLQSSFELEAVDATKNVFGDMLMIPVADLTNAEIEYSYSCDGGEVRSATIPINTSTVTAWKHGQNYSYSITMSTADLSISVNVLPWNEIDSSVSWDDGDKNN